MAGPKMDISARSTEAALIIDAAWLIAFTKRFVYSGSAIGLYCIGVP
jgi:hypothetical protein